MGGLLLERVFYWRAHGSYIQISKTKVRDDHLIASVSDRLQFEAVEVFTLAILTPYIFGRILYCPNSLKLGQSDKLADLV